MKRKLLNGKYRLYYYDATELSIAEPSQLQERKIPFIDAQVPGNVELDLSAAGLLPEDLYFGENIRKVQQWELYDFWYEREFELSAEQTSGDCYLEFLGVDLVATYFLNGKEIGRSRNMLVEHCFPVAGVARAGRNTLSVKLESTIKYAAGKEYLSYIQTFPINYEASFLRKAPHSFGWDIMPRALSCGIWRDVNFIEKGEVEIERLYLATANVSKDRKRADIYAQYQIKMPVGLFGKLRLSLEGSCNGHTFSYDTMLRFNQGSFYVKVAEPRLWWPLEMGDAELYTVVARLTDEKGKVLAERSLRFGIRELRIDFSERYGEKNSFQITVNHEPMFVKGTNWVPADVFHSKDAQRLPKMLEELSALRCNMVRCWGGNVYEADSFFEYCDEHGILVWQDFAMSCSAYPCVPEFEEEIAQEVKKLALRLRNHPSLALYCGDNECDLFLCDRHLDPGKNKLTREVIPDALYLWDPFRRYIRSSPYVSPSNFRNNKLMFLPEDHLWGARDNFKSSYYTNKEVSFIGETGYHGCVNVSSMKKFLSPGHRKLSADDEEWVLHGTSSANGGVQDENGHRIALMISQVRELFGTVPEELEKFSLASQIVQAEALKFFIEFTRQNRPHRTGILWWNLIDGWPQFSDAVIDYFYSKKLAYTYIQRSQRPVQLILKEPYEWFMEAIIDNVSLTPSRGSYEIEDVETGRIVLSGSFEAGANATVSLGKIPVSNGEHKVFLLKTMHEDCVELNHYLQGFSPIDLDWYCRQFEKIAERYPAFSLQNVGK